jgi:threonine dehydrogenase-like Zn-dependent dehydrogenase
LAETGLRTVHPDQALGDCDLAFHCSATAAGLARSLELLGTEGQVVELSWFGQTEPAVPLGGDFHARRLSLTSSQVGSVAPSRRARRTHADRLELALGRLADPAFDTLLSGTSPFEDLPRAMQRLADGSLDALCHVITYPGPDHQEHPCTP